MTLGSYSVVRLLCAAVCDAVSRAAPSLVQWSRWGAALILFGVLHTSAATFWLLIAPLGSILQQSLLRGTSQ